MIEIKEMFKLVHDEMEKIINAIEKLTNHNQTDHNIFYKKLIELENENIELKTRITALELKL